MVGPGMGFSNQVAVPSLGAVSFPIRLVFRLFPDEKDILLFRRARLTRTERAEERSVRDIGFLLLPGFALMSYSSATEPLRAANNLASQTLYRLRNFSLAGGIVASSGSAHVPTEPLTEAGRELSILFVCAAGRPQDWDMPRLHAPLKYLARHGARLGGISGGSWVLADAGLLAGRAFTIHWEHRPAFRERFPELEPTRARFVIDRDRITCGGGIAPLDMMHALITERLGGAFAQRVSDWYLHTAVGDASGPQMSALAERYGAHHPALLAALERMEAAIEQPLGRADVARDAGVSMRQLDRLFSTHLGRSFSDVYRDIRLRHALTLLRQSALSVSEVGIATGFADPGHFSRVVKGATGLSPRAWRERRRSDRLG
jgi:transcriptional regulator GlxA family with amidase domain